MPRPQACPPRCPERFAERAHPGTAQPHSCRQRGAALLSAMLTVALVASLTAAALWTQWRQVEIEIAERGRAQNQWLMTGALDWTRLILSEDARSAQGADHLGEPWAMPVQESKLSTFLSQDQQWREGDPEVYLSGQISDAQARLNLTSLQAPTPNNPAAAATAALQIAAWQRLFELLDLPATELQSLLRLWPLALAAAQPDPGKPAPTPDTSGQVPLLPQRIEQLGWVGLSPSTIARLRPYITLLPHPTPVNLNTAPAPVLQAVIPGLDAASARRLMAQRDSKPWLNMQDLDQALGKRSGIVLDPNLHDIKSSHFEIQGRLRVEQHLQDEWVLVNRQERQVRMLQRHRAAQTTAPSGTGFEAQP